MVRRWSAKSCFWSGQTLGQTWSTLVKLGKISPNLEKCTPGRILRALKCDRTPLRPSRLYLGCLVLCADNRENFGGKNRVMIGFVKKFEPKTCFGEKRFRGLSRQNRAKFSSGTILPPNAPYSPFGHENR